MFVFKCQLPSVNPQPGCTHPSAKHVTIMHISSGSNSRLRELLKYVRQRAAVSRKWQPPPDETQQVRQEREVAPLMRVMTTQLVGPLIARQNAGVCDEQEGRATKETELQLNGGTKKVNVLSGVLEGSCDCEIMALIKACSTERQGLCLQFRVWTYSSRHTRHL